MLRLYGIGNVKPTPNSGEESLCSFRSSSTPVRVAKRKMRKIKKMAAANKDKSKNSNSTEEAMSRIQAKIQEKKGGRSRSSSHRRSQLNGEERDDPNSGPEIMALLSDDIEMMELETEKLLEELKRANRQAAASDAEDNTKKKEDDEISDMDSDECNGNGDPVRDRITELEAENKVLQQKWQAEQDRVDSFRANIARISYSNHVCEQALKEAEAASHALQLEQEQLCSKLQTAQEDHDVLKTKASYKQSIRSAEIEQTKVFEQATKDILELEATHRLRQQQKEQGMNKLWWEL